MRRLLLFLVVGFFFLPGHVWPGEKAATKTIIYLERLQAEGGGFRPSQDAGQPSLRATTAAIRAMGYLGVQTNHQRAIGFVESCYDASTGGFRDSRTAKPDVFSTAVGIMAVVDLKVPGERMTGPALRYLSEHAQSFEEIRIAAAAFESARKPAPRKEQWLKEIRKNANADGSFGKGAGQARATGGAVAAILRLGGTIEHREQVLTALKRGQRPTGGFGKEDAGEASDLETTYRVMRAFMMLKARPSDVPALEAFIAKCLNTDGGYGVAPGQASSVAGCYYAAIVRHWLKE